MTEGQIGPAPILSDMMVRIDAQTRQILFVGSQLTDGLPNTYTVPPQWDKIDTPGTKFLEPDNQTVRVEPPIEA
jgi:hypothetical protein